MDKYTIEGKTHVYFACELVDPDHANTTDIIGFFMDDLEAGHPSMKMVDYWFGASETKESEIIAHLVEIRNEFDSPRDIWQDCIGTTDPDFWDEIERQEQEDYE